MALNTNKLIIQNMNGSSNFFYNIEKEDYINFFIDIYINKRKKEFHKFDFKQILTLKEAICKEIKVQDLENYTRCKFIKIENWYTQQVEFVDIDKDIIPFIEKLNKKWIKTVFSCQGGYWVDYLKAIKTWKIQKEGESIAKQGDKLIVLKRDMHTDVIDEGVCAYLILESNSLTQKFIDFLKTKDLKFINIENLQLWIWKDAKNRIGLYARTIIETKKGKEIFNGYMIWNTKEETLKKAITVANWFWNELEKYLEDFN